MSDFLYPFLDDAPPDVPALLADLAASAQAKAAESRALQLRTVERRHAQLAEAGRAIATRLCAGGRLYTFGNGGSSTDAASIATLFAAPPWGRALGGRCLADDATILSALGNDVGFELTFSRQVIAHGRAGDVAVGLSTSGNSRNVLTALGEARSRGMLTIAFAGYDGGEMARAEVIDHCFVVEADSIHRIQEAQAALSVALWSAVQQHLVPAAALRG
jgi:D-sedoheptulose 7-phosphate isomerase